MIKDKLIALRDYYQNTRQVGHSTLLKIGIDNFKGPKLVFAYKKDNELGIKSNEIISWHNLDKNSLRGENKPLAIDNGAFWLLLNESLAYIDELEKDREQLK